MITDEKITPAQQEILVVEDTKASLPSRWVPTRAMAVKISLYYALLSAIWIFFTGWLLHHFVQDPFWVEWIEYCKGWFFILVTAFLLGLVLDRVFWKIRNFVQRIQDSEAKMHRLNRELRAISNCNQTLLRATDEQSLLEETCRIVCEEAGYRMAWVAYAEHDEAKSVRPVAWAGAEEGYLVTVSITWADTERGSGPTGTAIRSGKTCCIQDFATDPRVAPWRESALQYGFRSTIALPLKDEHANTFGSLTIHSAQPNAFTSEEIRLLEELAADLAFGIVTLRSRAARKQAEQKVALLSFALDNVRETAFLVDDKGRFHYVNEGGCRVLGYSHAELLGLGVADIDPEFPAQRWSDHWSDLKAQRSRTFESRHRTRDGRIFPVEISANYFEYGGRAYNLALVRDITERKRAEEKINHLAAIVESTDDAVIGKTLDGKIISWNQGAEQIYGYTAGKIIGQPISVLVPASHREELDAIMVRLKAGEKIQHLETVRVRKDGQAIDVAVTISPIKDAGGRIVGASTIARDITERKRAENEIRKLNEELEQRVKQRTEELVVTKERAEAANRAKSIFLASMSHELRTPLNVVLGFSRLMKNDQGVPANQKENLDIIVRSGEHLLNLINNVLDMSKIESGQVFLKESDVDLHQLLHELQSLMGVAAAEKGLSFTLDQSPTLPRQIAVDVGKLRQVLINLIGNALKYTESGGVKLRAEVVSCETPQRARLRFEVEDSGPGISEEDRKRIFFPFVQLGNRAPIEAGTGLGLAISKEYVELMGGQIDVASEPGKGSVFHFEIPVAVLPMVEAPAELGRGRIVGLVEGQPRFRLLIAEDQQENRLLLHKLFEPLGFELRDAVNGQEAVALFEEWHPHLIWMDIRMPVMDGLEAARRIKATEAGGRTKIVALTAHALDEEREPILAAGCDDLVRKPFREQELFEVMARHLGLKYLYEKEGERILPPGPKAAFRPEQWAALPAELLTQLHQAAVELDTNRTLALIERVKEHDASIGGCLHELARNLDYPQLLRLLESDITKGGQTS